MRWVRTLVIGATLAALFAGCDEPAPPQESDSEVAGREPLSEVDDRTADSDSDSDSDSEAGDRTSESEPESDSESGSDSESEAWPEGLGVDTPFDDPSGTALDHFHRALGRAAAGEGFASVAVWGASHTACDHWTSRIRDALQERYGDGGRGFTFAAWPNERAYWQSGVRVDPGEGWARLRLGRDRSVADHYGVAGLVFDSEGREASARVRTGEWGVGEAASRFDVYFQRQPAGGTFEVAVDGELVATVETEGSVGAASQRVEVPEGPHALTLRALPDKSVRLYGVDVRRGESGVVLHNLGLSGSRARYHQKWRDPVHAQQLEALSLDLLVFAYGGNEGNDHAEPMTRFAGQFERALRRAQEHSPGASCLVVGPADKPLLEGGRWTPRVRTRGIAAAQRRIAHRLGCAYFDTIAFMGGEMSMVRWVETDLARDDFVHFTARGYDRFGDVLLEGLLPD